SVLGLAFGSRSRPMISSACPLTSPSRHVSHLRLVFRLRPSSHTSRTLTRWPTPKPKLIAMTSSHLGTFRYLQISGGAWSCPLSRHSVGARGRLLCHVDDEHRRDLLLKLDGR